MTQSTTPSFDDEIIPDEGSELDNTSGPAQVVEDDDANDLDLEVEDDANLDVDVPSDDEVETLPEATATDANKAEAKATKTVRQKAPEGYVKPVEFAKLLSEHLGKTVPPQVVYSTIKTNTGEGARNPFPVHDLEGYAWNIKPEEGLAWWDAKNERVAAGKAAKADKAKAKAEKDAAKANATASASTEPVVEAE